MDELRVVRREDDSLIVATEAGEEFRLIVDAAVLAELRGVARGAADGVRVRPREIQSLVRAGKTRAEIAELTGAEESDIERYEGPVLAERKFILSSAHKIAVRTSPVEHGEEQFGAVVAERLIGLGATQIEWDSWRDEEAGWMVGLEFSARDVDHRAIWSFDHRKGVLSPITPDAVTLSKQGEVGDRLIPKLRAVDDLDGRGRFDSGAFDRADALLDEGAHETGLQADSVESITGEDPGFSPAAEAALKAGHPSTGSIPVISGDSEYARRREIEERAIKSSTPDLPDLGQTADLLEALRRRRGEREGTGVAEEQMTDDQALPQPVPLYTLDPDPKISDETTPREFDQLPTVKNLDSAAPAMNHPQQPAVEPSSFENEAKPESAKRGKGRASIPSWDDILFGTRGDGDD